MYDGGAQHASFVYKFTGKERDAESGLDNFGARYNASAMGRFMSPDPSNLSVDFQVPQSWNRYAYVLNNPMAMVDRNGLWPTSIHNEIIDQAFPGLSAGELASLKSASAEVDKDQSPEEAYKHGMSNGYDPNGPLNAMILSDYYIHQNEETAEGVEADWLASGHAGIAPNAMTAFGNALHTVTDKTSPAHEGYQRWYGEGNGLRALWHVVRESSPFFSSARRDSAVKAAREAYLRTFGLMALLHAIDGLTPHVTHKIIYNDANPVEPGELSVLH